MDIIRSDAEREWEVAALTGQIWRVCTEGDYGFSNGYVIFSQIITIEGDFREEIPDHEWRSLLSDAIGEALNWLTDADADAPSIAWEALCDQDEQEVN